MLDKFVEDTDVLEDLVKEFGEDNRELIELALEFFDNKLSNHVVWPFDRYDYIRELLKQKA